MHYTSSKYCNIPLIKVNILVGHKSNDIVKRALLVGINI